MTDSADAIPLLILLVGVIVVLTPTIRAGMMRVRLPAMVGYILVGLVLGVLDSRTGLFARELRDGIRVFAQVGVVVLLFRIGLESNLGMLVRNLPRASMVWLGDVATSAGIGYLASRYVLGYDLIPSLFVAAALSATSVGVSTAIWRDADALETDSGALLTDVAELDDISAVFVMTLLFALAPVMRAGSETSFLPAVGGEIAWLGLKFFALMALCVLFSLRLERRLTRWFARLDRRVGPVLFVTGCAFVIAAAAEQLGFSLAIGAVFAGLAFSRDPAEQRIDRAFEPIYHLFSPFFFIGIGLAMDPSLFADAAGLGALLLLAAALGKLVGAGAPAALVTGGAGGLLIGISMIPRAEIALIIMGHGLQSGDWAVPPELYGGMVVMTLGTCVAVPLVIRRLLSGQAKQGGRHGR